MPSSTHRTRVKESSLLNEVVGASFRVDGFLDSGAMACVYRATQLSLERQVALKVLQCSSLDDQMEERFLREALVISRLEHPHIVRLYEFGKDDQLDILYLAMEFIEGVTLQRITKQGRADQRLVLEFATQITRALTEAHDGGIVHRDLKPANLLVKVQADGRLCVKVVDFGLARSLEIDGQLTADNVICGTPRYLAPEQALSNQSISGSMDLYSLGVILYEMLTGAPPFEAPGGLEVIMKHVHEPVRPPSCFLSREELHPELEAIVLSLLQKSPASRPRSALALQDSLEQLAAIIPGTLPKFSRHRPLGEQLDALVLPARLHTLEEHLESGLSTVHDSLDPHDTQLEPHQDTVVVEGLLPDTRPEVAALGEDRRTTTSWKRQDLPAGMSRGEEEETAHALAQAPLRHPAPGQPAAPLRIGVTPHALSALDTMAVSFPVEPAQRDAAPASYMMEVLLGGVCLCVLLFGGIFFWTSLPSQPEKPAQELPLAGERAPVELVEVTPPAPEVELVVEPVVEPAVLEAEPDEPAPRVEQKPRVAQEPAQKIRKPVRKRSTKKTVERKPEPARELELLLSPREEPKKKDVKSSLRSSLKALKEK